MEINCFLSKISNLKGIIFDLDGVLVESSKMHEFAFKESLKRISDYFEYGSYSGMSTEETFKQFLSNPETLSKLKNEKQKIFTEKLGEIRIYNKVTELLDLLKRRNIKIALATSASKDRTNKLLSVLGLDRYFDSIITELDVNKAKPSPEIYLKALEKLGLRKEEVLIVEDSLNGILSAKRARISVLGLLQTSHETDLSDADFILRDIYSLYSIFTYQLYSINPIKNNKKIEEFDVIIPAAGMGTRLGYEGPKILFPLTKNMNVLDLLIEKVRGVAKNIIIVTNPAYFDKIKDYVEKKHIPARVIKILNSKGTADTIDCAKEEVKSKNCLIIWGDQAGIKKESIINLIRTHGELSSDLSLPVILRKNPYIHLERDSCGKIISILRKKLNNALPEYGENDSGVFLVNSEELFKMIGILKKDKNKWIEDGEIDFLNIIPIISRSKKVCCVRCVNENEAIGINTIEEAEFHKRLLNL